MAGREDRRAMLPLVKFPDRDCTSRPSGVCRMVLHRQAGAFRVDHPYVEQRSVVRRPGTCHGAHRDSSRIDPQDRSWKTSIERWRSGRARRITPHSGPWPIRCAVSQPAGSHRLAGSRSLAKVAVTATHWATFGVVAEMQLPAPLVFGHPSTRLRFRRAVPWWLFLMKPLL